jgi:hypothetical protein
MRTPEEIKNRMKEITLQESYNDTIFNYCDRWCEKCPFTSRCLNFALSVEDPHLDDKEGWKYLKNVVDATCLMLDDLMEINGYDVTKIENIILTPSHDPESYPLSIYVRETAFKIHNWLKKNDLFDRLNNLLDLGVQLSEKFSRYKESVEVIYRYNFLFAAKITRAVAGLLENREYSLYDMNGSAKVALVSIDRLIVAWSFILTESSQIEDEILEILISLSEVRKRTELTFPDARKFIRPGLDENESKTIRSLQTGHEICK